MADITPQEWRELKSKIDGISIGLAELKGKTAEPMIFIYMIIACLFCFGTGCFVASSLPPEFSYVSHILFCVGIFAAILPAPVYLYWTFRIENDPAPPTEKQKGTWINIPLTLRMK